MQDIHHEHLSSMMDGELADQDVPGFLERFQSDPHLHKKLDRYGLIRTAIRGEQMLMDHNLADRIRAALADEPTILVRDRVPSPPGRGLG